MHRFCMWSIFVLLVNEFFLVLLGANWVRIMQPHSIEQKKSTIYIKSTIFSSASYSTTNTTEEMLIAFSSTWPQHCSMPWRTNAFRWKYSQHLFHCICGAYTLKKTHTFTIFWKEKFLLARKGTWNRKVVINMLNGKCRTQNLATLKCKLNQNGYIASQKNIQSNPFLSKPICSDLKIINGFICVDMYIIYYTAEAEKNIRKFFSSRKWTKKKWKMDISLMPRTKIRNNDKSKWTLLQRTHKLFRKAYKSH